VGQYETCVVDSQCNAPPDGYRNANNSYYNWGAADRRDHPINAVTWDEANAYCAWTGGRLPTEWEWEWAARGRGLARVYPWGDTPEPNCNVAVMFESGLGNGCGVDHSDVVGSKSPAGDSLDGVQDMAGNVVEWTDSFDSGTSGLRGGSWSVFLTDAFRADYRNFNDPSSRFNTVGFRCARSAP